MNIAQRTEITKQPAPAPKRFNRNILELGLKDGILISHTEDAYQIQMPDRYDLYYALVGKNKLGNIVDRVKPLDAHQTVKDVIVNIPLDKLNTAQAVQSLGQLIAHARITNLEIQEEIIAQDCYINAWAITGDYDKKSVPKNGELKGEFTAIGKYFLSLKQITDNPDSKQILRIIPTNRILKFEDGDFDFKVNRLDRVKERLNISQADYTGKSPFASLKTGIVRCMAFDESGRCTNIYHPDTPQPPKAENPIIVKKQVEKSDAMAIH